MRLAAGCAIRLDMLRVPTDVFADERSSVRDFLYDKGPAYRGKAQRNSALILNPAVAPRRPIRARDRCCAGLARGQMRRWVSGLTGPLRVLMLGYLAGHDLRR